MDEYISKQRAKDLMGCCIASAKANLKVETNIFKKAEYESIIRTIESMIDVVGAVEAADVQPVKHGIWLDNPNQSQLYSYICSNCRNSCDWTYRYCPNCGSKNRMDGDSE